MTNVQVVRLQELERPNATGAAIMVYTTMITLHQHHVLTLRPADRHQRPLRHHLRHHLLYARAILAPLLLQRAQQQQQSVRKAAKTARHVTLGTY